MDDINKKDIEEILDNSHEPCLTLLMPTETIAGEAVDKMKIRYKNLIKEGEKKLKERWNYSDEDVQKFLKPLKKYLNDRDFWLNQSSGLVMLKDKDNFAYYRLPVKFREKVALEKHFHIKPYVSEILSERRFFLLAVSRNSCRFFQGTPRDIEEITIEDLPQGIDALIADEDLESSTQQHSAARGGASVIHHGHDDRDQKAPAELLRYLKAINSSLKPHFQDKNLPLIVMCVKDLFPHLKKVFEYQNLLDKFIQGNPDRLSPKELLDKARPIIEPHFKHPYNEMAEKYQELKGSENTSAQIEEIAPASYQGRIANLLVSAAKDKNGIYHSDKGEIELGLNPPEGYDLINFSVINTLKTGGDIYLFSGDEIPDNSNICAIFRY